MYRRTDVQMYRCIDSIGVDIDASVRVCGRVGVRVGGWLEYVRVRVRGSTWFNIKCKIKRSRALQNNRGTSILEYGVCVLDLAGPRVSRSVGTSMSS